MPEPYRLVFTRSARRELEQLPAQHLERMVRKIQNLAADPRPPGSKKLVGTEFNRMRQGDYRVVYRVDDKQRLIDILHIGHRREVYR